MEVVNHANPILLGMVLGQTQVKFLVQKRSTKETMPIVKMIGYMPQIGRILHMKMGKFLTWWRHALNSRNMNMELISLYELESPLDKAMEPFRRRGKGQCSLLFSFQYPEIFNFFLTPNCWSDPIAVEILKANDQKDITAGSFNSALTSHILNDLESLTDACRIYIFEGEVFFPMIPLTVSKEAITGEARFSPAIANSAMVALKKKSKK